MSKRYYYNCPIKAIYMMREFRVEFVTKRGNRYSEKVIAEFVHDSCYGEIEDDAFYVAKESEEIFISKKADLILGDGGNIAKECEGGHVYKCSKIIMRDNKQFFMPEVENE